MSFKKLVRKVEGRRVEKRKFRLTQSLWPITVLSPPQLIDENEKSKFTAVQRLLDRR